jgi:hypothetical protein
MTIWVSPVSRFHSSETVKPSFWRVLSSTNTVVHLSGVVWRRLCVRGGRRLAMSGLGSGAKTDVRNLRVRMRKASAASCPIASRGP